MPKRAHRAISREATKRGLTGKRRDAYVYGTLAKIDKARKAKRKK